MENNKSKNMLIIALVCVILLIVVILIFKFGKGSSNNPDNGETSYETLKIDHLNDKLSMISFSNQDYYEIAESNVTILTRVEENHVSVTYTFNDNTTRKYTVSSIPNILSLGCGFTADGKIARTFFLTKTGKVFMLEDKLDDVKSNGTYEGQPVDMGFDNATEIFVANGNLVLNDQPYSEPAVYIKTSDGKMYTNEKLLIGREQEGFVEIN